MIFIGKVGDKTDGATVPETGAECVAHNGWASGIGVIVSIISNIHYKINIIAAIFIAVLLEYHVSILQLTFG